ncbi:helix-turn-helix domain-containing protein [Shewanella nanhaiensis]|uniref:Helix-turn-helix domain-containing protein n=1 Tax=Shewanella nanhaiensis TaxID=2864872 RepID=A0ABS7E2A8_9GAMM|nr:helix-turn-helix transcriptional regulator [Shewanella nanhaiensis]MBW8183794.1 helix-turn-helix domain-containing protein [Shewanella nanhaiensis]
MFTTPEIVKSLRLSQGYSVTELASKMGCSRQTIYNWEDGVSEPKLSQFLHLCVIVGLNPNNLLPKIPSKMSKIQFTDKEFQDDNQQSSTDFTK